MLRPHVDAVLLVAVHHAEVGRDERDEACGADKRNVASLCTSGIAHRKHDWHEDERAAEVRLQHDECRRDRREDAGRQQRVAERGPSRKSQQRREADDHAELCELARLN